MDEKRPLCKGFLTYTELLLRASEGERAAIECLGRVIQYEIIPSFERRFPKIRLEDIEEIAWSVLLEFLSKIQLDKSKEYNIGLLWRIMKLRIIDFIRKNKGIYNDVDIDDLHNISEQDADNSGEYIDFNFSHIDESLINEFVKELKETLSEDER